MIVNFVGVKIFDKILNNPFIEEMYNKKKGKYEELIAENDKKWEQYAEDTLECAGILYKSIEQHINNKDISKKMQCRVRDLTMAYAKDGFKNRNKLNDILGGKSYEQ